MLGKEAISAVKPPAAPGCVVAPPLDPASRIPWWCLSLARLRYGGVGWGGGWVGKPEILWEKPNGYTPEKEI